MLKHAVSVPIPGYTELEVEFNISATAAAINLAQKQGRLGDYVTDFPNWDEVAPALEFVDEEGQPAAKPVPFTEDSAGVLPIVVSTWILSIGVSWAAGQYVKESVSPNSKRR